MTQLVLMQSGAVYATYDSERNRISVRTDHRGNGDYNAIDGTVEISFDDLVEIVCRADFEHEKILAKQPKG